MTTRIILIILAVLVIVGGAYAAIHWFGSAPTGTATTTNPFPNGGGSVSGGGTTSGQLTLQTNDGGTLSVPDFTQGHDSTAFGGTTYYFLTNNAATEGEDGWYDIQYGSDSNISIFLLREPIGEARTMAEAKLRELIPISDADLCRLKIDVGVTAAVNPTYAGPNLGLSFCPNSTQLPQ